MFPLYKQSNVVHTVNKKIKQLKEYSGKYMS